MSKGTHNVNPVENSYLIWVLIGVPLTIALSFILPYPLSSIVSLLLIGCAYIIKTNKVSRKSATEILREWYQPSSSEFDRGLGTKVNTVLHQSLRYFCLNCGEEHHKTECPRCSSKSVRVL